MYARMNSRLLGSLAALAMAMGVGAAALSQSPPPVVKIDSGELQGVSDRRRRLLQGHPLRGASCRRPAVAAAPAGSQVDGRAPGRGIRRGLHAGTVRLRPRPRLPGAPAPPDAVGRLPVPERLAPRRSRPRAKLPVMVWIYGGGFTGGSSASPNTSGVQFAKQGVVLVAMNYRVGRFGFFAFPGVEPRAS